MPTSLPETSIVSVTRTMDSTVMMGESMIMLVKVVTRVTEELTSWVRLPPMSMRMASTSLV